MSMRTGADGLPQWQVIWLCAKAEGAIAATIANATILIAILIEAPPGPISISRYFPISTRVNVPGTGLGLGFELSAVGGTGSFLPYLSRECGASWGPARLCARSRLSEGCKV